MKTFVPGAIASAADVNANFTELTTVLAARATVIAGPAVDGTPPAPFAPIIQAGTVVVQVEQNGYADFAWPQAFPGGLISCTAISGDTQAYAGAISFGTHGPTASRCYIHAPGASNVTVRINYVAIGF